MDQVNESAHIPDDFSDKSDRPQIKKYPKIIKFRPNDRVYLRASGTQIREGPYTVSAVQDGRYKLCDENGRPVNGGTLIEEEELVLLDPFE